MYHYYSCNSLWHTNKKQPEILQPRRTCSLVRLKAVISPLIDGEPLRSKGPSHESADSFSVLKSCFMFAVFSLK